MDCGLCIGHLREKRPCPGCNGDDAAKPRHCVVCRIRVCGEPEASESGFCFECVRFPCARLRQLDRRYRTKYGMSMIENLESMREIGVDGFVTKERERWMCPGCGGVVCVHLQECMYCGHVRS
jgi:hypothetical protein